MNKVAFFVSIFLFCTALGLYVGYRFIPEVGEINPLTGQSVDDPSGTLYFLAVVLVGTTTLLLILKYYKGLLLFKVLEIYIIFVGSMMAWQFIAYDILNAVPFIVTSMTVVIAYLTLSALTVIVRFLKRTFLVTNLTLAIAIGGVGGALGSFMGFIPSLLLMIALGTYDIIAVFKTKHMIKLADQSRLRQMPVMFEVSSKGIKTGPRKGKKKEEDVLGLGTGDIAIPLIFFVGVLRTFNDWLLVGGAVIGAMIGLAFTIYYVTQIKRVALPALPPIIGCSIIGLGGAFLLQALL
jgi:presenilin-like A22 family membrane protease